MRLRRSKRQFGHHIVQRLNESQEFAPQHDAAELRRERRIECPRGEKALEVLGKTKSPKVIGLLYSYRQGVARNLASNLLALGLEKAPPKQKTLEEILDEPEESDGVDEP